MMSVAHRRAMSALAVFGGLAFLSVWPAEFATAQQIHTVEMKDNKFVPALKEIKKGDIVVWINRGLVKHTATSSNPEFDMVILPRESGKPGNGNWWLFDAAAEVKYRCRLHDGMEGTIVVKE